MSTDQDLARERAAQELSRRVAPIAAIQDPLKWARDFIQEMTTPNPRGRWCYVHTTPGITPATPNPDAYERGGDLARDLLNIRKNDHA